MHVVWDAYLRLTSMTMRWPIASQSRKIRVEDGRMRRVGSRFWSWPSAGHAFKRGGQVRGRRPSLMLESTRL